MINKRFGSLIVLQRVKVKKYTSFNIILTAVEQISKPAGMVVKANKSVNSLLNPLFYSVTVFFFPFGFQNHS